jgi:hypothetical protein
MRTALGLFIASLIATPAAAQGFQRPISLTEPEEIELARSAAPAAVAAHATVLVLGPMGYRRVVTGTNGFTCLVEHEDPGAVEPVCYDGEGSETVLKVALFRAEGRAASQPDSALVREIEEGYVSGRFRVPSKPGVAYMLSPKASIPPHTMFYAPYATAETWGLPVAGQAAEGLPVLYNAGKPTAYVIVMRR